MLDQTHAAIMRPAALVVVSDDIVVRGIKVGAEVSLDEVVRLVGCEAE